MTRNMQQGRRAFLAGTAGLAAMLGFSRVAGGNAFEGDPTVRAMCTAARFDRRAASRIAKAYWQTEADERNLGVLMDRLRDRAGIDTFGCDQPRWVHDRMRQCIREDFAEGRTVMVDGWLLSQTEVRLCALTTLLPV